MKEILKNNLIYLKGKQPEIINKLVSQIDLIEENLKVIDTDNDIDILIKGNKLKGLKELSDKKINNLFEIIGSVYITDEEAILEKTNIFSKDLIKKRETFLRKTEALIVLGTLPFFHIKAIIEKKLFPELKTIVIHEENIEFIFFLLSNINIQKIVEVYKINFFLSYDLSFLETLLSYVLNYHPFVSYIKSYEDDRINLAEETLKKSHAINIKGFSIKLQKERIINTKENTLKLKNKRFLLREYSLDDLADIPVFIVGSGPSLDKSIETLKSLKDKAVFVSLTSTIYSLYKHDLIPDFISIIDPTKSLMTKFIKDIPDSILKKIYTFSGIYTPLTFNEKFKETLFFSYGFFKNLLSIKYKINAPEQGGTTVLNPTFTLLTTLGFKEIYLVGIDLGGKEKSTTHTKHYKELIYKQEEFFIEVEGNFGGKVYSRFDYYISKIVLEKQISTAKIKYPHLQVFNISDGAKIEGALPKKDVELLKELSVNIDKNSIKSKIVNIFEKEKVYINKEFVRLINKNHIPFFKNQIFLLEKSKAPAEILNILANIRKIILSDEILINLINPTSAFSLLLTYERLLSVSISENQNVNLASLKKIIKQILKHCLELLRAFN